MPIIQIRSHAPRAEVVVAQLTEQLGRVEEAIERHILQHQQRLMQSMGAYVRKKSVSRQARTPEDRLMRPYIFHLIHSRSFFFCLFYVV
jgi:hypothetical protein